MPFCVSPGDIRNEFKLELVSETGEKIEHQMDVSQFEDLFMGSVFGGFGNSYWINDELIYTTMLVRDRSEYGSKLIDTIPVILNPFTGSWEEDLLLSQTGLNRKDEIGFSQDLHKVVLQSREILLKDIKNNNPLWSTDRFFLGIPDSKIRWSPIGDYVAIGKRFPDPVILLVSADGKHSETLPIGNLSGYVNFEWSPNGQYIMIFHSYGDNEKQFYLYDTTKGQMVLACPVIQPLEVLFQWSPNSRQIIYGIYDGDLKLLDIPSGKIIQLENKDVLPVGWTAKSFSD
jgi:WD40 repeat protein